MIRALGARVELVVTSIVTAVMNNDISHFRLILAMLGSDLPPISRAIPLTRYGNVSIV